MNSQSEREVILGVDIHLDKHIGVVVNDVGKLLSHLSVATNSKGYQQLAEWSQTFGTLQGAGVEETGTYGAGLARYLAKKDIIVLKINRPDHSRRRSRGKSDYTDAESAARTVLSGVGNAIPKSQSGAAEAMRIILIARRSSVKART